MWLNCDFAQQLFCLRLGDLGGDLKILCTKVKSFYCLKRSILVLQRYSLIVLSGFTFLLWLNPHWPAAFFIVVRVQRAARTIPPQTFVSPHFSGVRGIFALSVLWYHRILENSNWFRVEGVIDWYWHRLWDYWHRLCKKDGKMFRDCSCLLS